MANEPYCDGTPWSLAMAKISVMAVLGVGTFVLGVSPLKLAERLWNDGDATSADVRGHHAQHHHGETVAHHNRTVSLILCFSGGVLMSTTVIHLQPEVREAIKRLQDDGHLFAAEHLGDLVMCAGFLIMLLIDQAVHVLVDWWSSKDERRPNTGAGRPVSFAMSTLTVTSDVPNDPSKRNSYRLATPFGLEDAMSAADKQFNDSAGAKNHQNGDGFGEAAGPLDGANGKRQFGGLFTVIALSMHECIEGMAVGLEKCEHGVWYLCLAIATHKLIIAFCLGLEMVYSNARRSLVFTYVFVFAVTTPLGVAVGMVLFHYSTGQSFDGLSSPVPTVLQGLAAGSLLYVVFFEILNKYIQPGFSHVFAISSGFVFLSFLHSFMHEHGHHHHHHYDHHHDHHDHNH